MLSALKAIILGHLPVVSFTSWLIDWRTRRRRKNPMISIRDFIFNNNLKSFDETNHTNQVYVWWLLVATTTTTTTASFIHSYSAKEDVLLSFKKCAWGEANRFDDNTTRTLTLWPYARKHARARLLQQPKDKGVNGRITRFSLRKGQKF